MEACVVICRNNKPSKRRGHVIFIDAVNEVTRERSMSYLKLNIRDGLRTRITLSRMWKALRRWLHWLTFAPTMAI
jgi:type I restriction-modification system DNA methylase subunit